MYEHLKRNLGLRVKAIRQHQGMTQPQLAEAIDKSFETISNIERGRTAPGFTTLAEIARVLGVPMREFSEPEDADTTDARQRLMAISSNNISAFLDGAPVNVVNNLD